MPHDPVSLALAGLYGISVLAVVFIAVRSARAPMVPPPDPAFREDAQWEGIEREWHEFVDALPEVQR